MGIDGPIEYEKKWLNEKVNYCRPYTGRMPGLYDWPHYVNSLNHFRKQNLYNKYKQYTIISSGGDVVTANTTYQDSFHEMHAQLSYSLTTREDYGFRYDDAEMAVCRMFRNGSHGGGSLYRKKYR